ncbi:MAG: hypothetical protein KTR29_12485 [Rhodothermaceae bacterium]|nr:hypothetical protein [Rhodothermaceae bacterium]
MQQTILAIGALLIIMTTAMLYQRSNMLTQELAYIRQIEIAAEDAARTKLEGLATLAFDESIVVSSSIEPDPNTFTAAASFGLDAGESYPSIVDDVDDYHGIKDTIWQSISVNADSFRFVVDYSVQYITTTGIVTTTPTNQKELIVEIESLDRIGTRQVKGTFTKLTSVNDNLTP